jgi:hypothetical protein
LSTEEGREVAVGERRGQGLRDLELSPGGELVQFGPTPTRDLGVASLGVDPGLPVWMAEHAAEQLPQLIASFSSLLGRPLASEPAFYLVYEPGEPTRGDVRGSTLARSAVFVASGGYWQQEDAWGRGVWARLLAHETLHLWSGGQYRLSRGPREEWLSEGAADYLAMRSLHERDAAPFLEEVARHAEHCLSALAGRPLRDAWQSSDPRLPYACGSTVLFVLDEGGGLPGLLDEVFDRADRKKNRYDARMLLRSVQERQVRAEVRALLERGEAAPIDLRVQEALLRAEQAPLESSARELVRRLLQVCAVPDVASIELVAGVDWQMQPLLALARARASIWETGTLPLQEGVAPPCAAERLQAPWLRLSSMSEGSP